MKTTRIITLAALLFASLGLFALNASAASYTWANQATGGDWNTATNWTPNGVPNADDADVSVTTTTSGQNIYLGNGTTTVRNLSATTNGGTNLTFSSPNTEGSATLAITGTLTKNNGSSSINFADDNTGRYLNLTINRLNFNTNGNFYFGRNDGGRRINSLAISTLDMGNNNSGSPTSILAFNATQNYSLGAVTFSGSNTKNVYLINNNSTGYSRTATIKSLTQTSGTAATIYGSQRAGSSGSNAAMLKIDTDAATAFTATTILADGTGGTLALLKTGAGKQTLTGVLTHTGGTQVDAGTLVITGSLAATGDLTVAKDATFVAGAALTLNDAAFASGAVLGLDLGANAKLNLSGDLTQSGSGEATFVIDFQSTGILDQTYTHLLSVAGANAFAGATLTYKNFGTQNLSGTLSMNELIGNFIVTSGAIPEPAAWVLLLGAGVFSFAALRRYLYRGLM
ncbi:autotransporter-associated beta strand repeat-containing protein [Geminisphaera colitermitum]|uniref:autotransporter-associated beta strand repeat-containing protein n=1 Tax=Geminisphaera colitermitum TaxID=1148786 RepID=UPI000158CADC|nr:autotransporter-associated beta strand repeat-containing protein [Geminisphaera colitermitum]